MTHHLVVTKPYLNFVQSDIIAEITKVREILSTEYKKFATKVALSTTPKG
jgi:hypothetical protein